MGDRHGTASMYSVLGPRSKDLVNLVADESVDELRFFSVMDNAVDGMFIWHNDVKCFTLSAEVGFLLMNDMRALNPFEVGNEGSICWDKEFVGKAALEKIRETGVRRQLVGFTVDDPSAIIVGQSMLSYQGTHLIKDGEDVGKATKYTMGFTCGKNIGYAVIDKNKAQIGDHVTLNGWDAVLCERKFI